MEIIINTENQILYKSLLSLLKTMGIKVKTEPKEITSNKKKQCQWDLKSKRKFIIILFVIIIIIALLCKYIIYYLYKWK